MRGVVSYDRDALRAKFISSVQYSTRFHRESLPYRVAPSRRRHRALAPDAPRGFVPGVPVPVPGRSEYDRYLDALPPSPIAGPVSYTHLTLPTILLV